MEFLHVIYKKIPVDEDNIFLANLTENNEVTQIKFKKSKIYTMSGLSINQDIQSNISLPKLKEKSP